MFMYELHQYEQIFFKFCTLIVLRKANHPLCFNIKHMGMYSMAFWLTNPGCLSSLSPMTTQWLFQKVFYLITMFYQKIATKLLM